MTTTAIRELFSGRIDRKIEEEIRDAIDQAQREWKKIAIQQKNLFGESDLEALGGSGAEISNDLQGLAKFFWIDIEERIYVALHDYAERAESRSGFQRRLFAEDAVQGFALIDICRKRYDVVLMNPPFGLGGKVIQKYTQQFYPDSSSDELAATFYTRALGLLSQSGKIGEISSRTFLFLPTLSQWRQHILFSESTLHLFADLGEQTLDGAFNETAAYVSSKGGYLSATASFGMCHRSDHPSDALLSLAERKSCDRVYYKALKSFLALEDCPLCYWVSNDFAASIKHLKPFGDKVADVQMGLAPRDEFRFSRLWWEVDPSKVGARKRWIHYAKGGKVSPYYSDIDLVLNSQGDLSEIKAALNQKYPYLKGNLGWVLNPENNYFQTGLTFGQRTTFLRMSILPKGCYFSVAGKAVFGKLYSDSFLLQAINTPSAQFLAYLRRESLSMNPQFQEGDVARIPWPDISEDALKRLEDLAFKSASAVRAVASFDETDHAFYSCDLHGEAMLIAKEAASIVLENESEADRIMSREIGLCASDLEFISKEIMPRWHDRSTANWHAEKQEPAVLSYLLGLLFGRWDANCSQKVDRFELECNLFAELPVYPSGQLQAVSRLPLSSPELPRDYPLSPCWDGILLSDPGHQRDIAGLILEAIENLGGFSGSANLSAVEDLCAGAKVTSLYEYFSRPSLFFANHLAIYSKSRRQAPIYWQLSAGSGSYSAWLYYHRFTQDTLYRVLRDFVEPRIQQAESEQFELESQGALSRDAAARLQEAQTLFQDLRILKSELDLVAPLWNPNLNDGVIINHAILWRITPYTPWQKKCKECWDKLVKGDYDWAHLAFHLWPEQVIPKCTTDRSLAIAHGLEDRLWQETNNGNWLPRQLSEADLQALITEHSKPAVKNALERFLAAPPPVAPTRTRASGSSTPRRPRGTAAVVDAEATRQVLLALTAAPSDGLAKAAIADLIGVEANALTAVIKQLKESCQIDQLGERRGARYVLSEQVRARLEQEES